MLDSHADATSTSAHFDAEVDARAGGILDFYRDLHRHPELSGVEYRTAERVARAFTSAGAEVTTGVGGTGVVGVLTNGEGPIVLLRADMDALPVQELTGLPYASTVTTIVDGETLPVMHACGHDLHTAALVGAVDILASSRGRWSGTVVAVAQPAEETLSGARSMLDDGLYDRFPRPDVALGQHVGIGPVGTVQHRPGSVLTATAKVQLRVFGRGGHGAMPHVANDPVVTAAHIVTRLQSLVARDSDPRASNVVTVGSLTAGVRSNVIPDEAALQISIRAQDDDNLDMLLNRMREVARGEAMAGGCPREPEMTISARGGATVNDAATHDLVAAAHRSWLGDEAVWDQESVIMASEDFGLLSGAEHLQDGQRPVPTHFWFVGSMDPAVWGPAPTGRTPPPAALPAGHSPSFAPMLEAVPHAVRTLLSAALVFLDTPTGD